MNIAIVTDSTADIPSSLAEQYQVYVIRNLLVIDGQSLEDGVGISREEFYTRLPNMQTPPTTATASSGAYQQLYENLLRRGAQSILSIHVSSKLSGVFNAASLAAQAFGDRVHVIDSGQVSMGLGFQVLAVAEAISRGGLLLESALHLLSDVRRRVRLIAMLDTLEYVRRSGRVSWARARLGALLQVKPFIDVQEGEVIRLGDVRTRSKGIARLEELLRGLGALERLALLHTNAETDARQILVDLQPDLPSPPILVNVTTAIGTHVGPNGLGFAAVLR